MTSNGGLQSRSGRTGQENLPLFAQKLPAYAPPSCATRTSIGGLQARRGRMGRENLPFAQKLPAYAPLLVQRALALGACSQEAEGQAGKASSADSAICEKTSYISNQPLPSLFLSFGSQSWQRAALYKHLSFAQKLPAYTLHLVQRALVMGACRQEAEGRAGKICHSRRSCQHTPPFLCHAH